jgi:hypothetical protein
MAVVAIFSYEGKTVAWPPYVLVKPGDEVVFKTVNTAASIFLPTPGIFTVTSASRAGTRTAAGITMSLAGKQSAGKVKVKGQTKVVRGKTKYSAGSPAPGIYPYSVYCTGPNEFAVGNSAPAMIIEPPEP